MSLENPIGAQALHQYLEYAQAKNQVVIEGKTPISQKRLVVFKDSTGKDQITCWNWEETRFFTKCLAVLGIGKYSTDFNRVARTVKDQIESNPLSFAPTELNTFSSILQTYKIKKESALLSRLFHLQVIDSAIITAINKMAPIVLVPISDDVSFRSQYTALFENNQYKGRVNHRSWQSWEMFSISSTSSPASDPDIKGYDDAKRQWKIFLNPKRDYFIPTLERVLQVAVDHNITIGGKIWGAITQPRKGQLPVGDDPCEPKMVIYFTEENSQKSQEKLRKFTEALEQVFTRDEIDTVGCDEGKRQVWVKNEDGQYEKQEKPQWGPSFTKQYNKLIYYTQGGYSESGRNLFVSGEYFDEAGMNEKFEGTNFYRYKGETDPFEGNTRQIEIPSDQELIDGAKMRLIHLKENEQKSGEGLKMRLFKAKDDEEKARLETMMAMRKHRKEESSIVSLTAKARIELNKENVTDEEVAAIAKMSITDFRFMKIQQGTEVLPEGVIDEVKTAKNLEISLEDLRRGLINCEKIMLLREALTQFGTSTFNQLPPLAQLDLFCDTLKANLSDFGKPFDILKLYHLRHNIDSLKESRAKQGVLRKADALIGDMIQNMERTRQGALLSLVEGAATPEDLRKVIFSKLFCAKSNAAIVAPRVQALTVENQIQEIHDQAQKTLEKINMLRKSSDIYKNYNKIKGELPQSIQHFLDSGAGKKQVTAGLEIVAAKLEHIIARQKKRLEMLKSEKGVQLPQFFHATNDQNAVFSITSTGIRPSEASYYGAFVSTYPAMLRYGGVVIGLPQRAAFASDVGTIPRSGRTLVVPDHDMLDPAVLRDREREKWIGFAQEVGINPYALEAKENFLQTFSFALKKSYEEYCHAQKKEVKLDEFAEIESQIFSELKKKNLIFSFNKESKKWEAVIEEKRGVKSQYVLLNQDKLKNIVNDIQFKSDEKRNIIENIFKTTVVSDTMAVSSPSGTPLRPYYINIDEEEMVKAYFTNENLWPKKSKAITPTTEGLKQQYKERVGYEELKTRAKMSVDSASQKAAKELLKEVDGFIETHFVPLLEQLIEFDFMSKEGVLLRREWLVHDD